jgi:hypothetical protein
MSPTTTHADKVAGWIVIGLFAGAIIAMTYAAFQPNVDPSSRAQLLSIAAGALGAMAGSLTTGRRQVQQQDTSQQVTIPSSDGTPPVTIQTSTGAPPVSPAVSPAPEPATPAETTP